ncbi:MAG: 4Fe-4S dicluster domain-containing protein [Clostridia bacterium]|nr:4Fe-4S dicluster domain-containing protein [Clostridia bacterium]
MILDFPGGVRPLSRTKLGKSNIEYISACSAVCTKADEGAKTVAAIGSRVLRGSLIGESGGTPVYASVAGVFRGIMELEGNRYFVVMNSGEDGEEAVYSPESRAITELNCADICESARRLSVVETRSGAPLWKMLENANGKFRRLVIDCTETDASGAINYRLCIEQAKALVGGAKLLLQATGALKCVFAAEHYRNAALESILKYANDEKLFAIAQLDEKYPYGDRAIMEALYLTTLDKNETASDRGIFIVSPETAAALYNSMAQGMPMLDRYITVCGDEIAQGKNLCVPRGITLHDISVICGGIKKGGRLIENSLLSGKLASGALSDCTRTLIAAKKQTKARTECISCGKCADACPIRLMPLNVLAGDIDDLRDNCIYCGACEFICPSGIPLLKLIKKRCNAEAEQ